MYGLYFLVEQMFICMLGTYRPELLNQESQDMSLLGFLEPAKYLIDMSNEVFRITRWQGMLQRGAGSCGIQYGANCSSPIFEYGRMSEKFLLYAKTSMSRKEIPLYPRPFTDVLIAK